MSNDLGVTHDDVEARYHGLSLSASTSPTAAQVDAWCDSQARIEIAWLHGLQGAAPTLTAGQPDHDLLSEQTIRIVLARVDEARHRGATDWSRDLRRMWREERHAYTEARQSLGSRHRTALDAPATASTHVSREDEIADKLAERGADARLHRMLASRTR